MIGFEIVFGVVTVAGLVLAIDALMSKRDWGENER